MNKNKQTLFLIFILLLALGCGRRDVSLPNSHIPPLSPDQIFRQTCLSVKDLPNERQQIVHHALGAVGSDYRWGGHSPSHGFDCSGLVYYIHRRVGISLPRTTSGLFKNGRGVSSMDMKPGDLIFFEIPEAPKKMHVGIYIGDSIFIHAPGKGRKVSYASLNNNYFKSHLIGFRTYINTF